MAEMGEFDPNLSCAFFWVIPRRLNFMRRRFGTLRLFRLCSRVGMKKFVCCGKIVSVSFISVSLYFSKCSFVSSQSTSDKHSKQSRASSTWKISPVTPRITTNA